MRRSARGGRGSRSRCSWREACPNDCNRPHSRLGCHPAGRYTRLSRTQPEALIPMATLEAVPKTQETLGHAVIRFCGDSGDGMQITGAQFTSTAALFGNDLATFPDFPAEIRAPAGTLPGVSGFQVNFSSSDVFTPGQDRKST